MVYYNGKRLLKIHANYYIIFGERSNGKSYYIKRTLLERWIKHGEEMVYIRRYDSDITNDLVNSYFADAPIAEISKGAYNNIYAYGGRIYCCHIDDDGKRDNAKVCGYVRSISSASRYASTAYPRVGGILLEEAFAADGRYLSNELTLFLHLVSTISRDRNIPVYLVGNSISRICPYWREFGADGIINSIQQGEIRVIERDTSNGKQIVAIEYCANAKGRISTMFAGSREAMTNDGKWLATDMPKLPMSVDNLDCVYRYVVQYKQVMYMVQYLIRPEDGVDLLYVTPKTTPIKSGTRVFSDRASIDPLWTRGYKPMCDLERQIMSLADTGKIYYSDNLTGTEYRQCIKMLRNISLDICT